MTLGVEESRRIRPATRMDGVRAYTLQRRPQPIDLWLDANEGPAQASLAARVRAMADAERVRRYPGGEAARLEAAIARWLGVDSSRVVATAGGDDAIDRVCRALLESGREAVTTTPTFEMIGRSVRLSGGALIEVPWLGGALPVGAMEDAITRRTGTVFVVTPNNPTGSAASIDDLRRLSARLAGGVLVVDLAYTEFADEDLTRAALDLPNVVVIRTFSKAWGGAGLRVGCAIGPAPVMEWVRAAGMPFAMSAVSAATACAMLERGESEIVPAIARVRRERAALRALLDELGAETLASQGNFVLTRPRGVVDGSMLADLLAGLGIAVREFRTPECVRGWVRITCPGEQSAWERLERALRTALAPRAMLLDMDGVIADVSSSYRVAIVEAARALGADVSVEEVAAAKRRPDSNNDWVVTQRLARSQGVEATLEESRDAFERIYQAGLWRREGLIPRRATLELLAARMPLAIVTGRPRADAERFLEKESIRGLFRAVVTMEDADRKPSPAPVRLAMSLLGVTEAWMVGDAVDDVTSARSAGVAPLGVVTPGEDMETAHRTLLGAGAARVMRTLDEIEGATP